MDESEVDALARTLLDAARTRRPIGQLTVGHPDLDAAAAYRVQRAVVAARLAGGERIVGWKVGLTSRAMQQQLGVDSPDYGPILSGYLVPDGGTVARDELIAPRVEAEIAFLLGAPLAGPGVTTADVLRATVGVRPAIEIIDSRIADWKLTLPDTVADLASSARVVFGGPVTPVDGLDLRLIGAILERNGQVVGSGAGAAVLGDPVAAVAWAAETLGALGERMEPGHVVIPGALHASVPAERGDAFTATFDRLGTVSVHFS
jgi:2-keto-4-pentenoate hydratase